MAVHPCFPIFLNLSFFFYIPHNTAFLFIEDSDLGIIGFCHVPASGGLLKC